VRSRAPIVFALVLALVALMVPFSSAAAGAVPQASLAGSTVVVVPDRSTPTATVAAAVRAAGATVVETGTAARLLVAKPPAGTSASELAAQLGDAAGVALAQVNRRYVAAFFPNDPAFPQQWGLTKVGATRAWDTTTGDPAVVVAVLDSGVDLTHPDLVDRLVPGYDFMDHDTVPQDDFGHGTHVAGIIAATTDNGVGVAGVAPTVKIMPLRVLRYDRLTDQAVGDTFALAQAIRYAADHGADVINMSLGGDHSVDDPVRGAVQYALSRQVVLVAAAGNEGAQSVLYPASEYGVLGIGSSSSADVVSSYSNHGSGVDLVAPGESIYSTNWTLASGSTYGIKFGTSMATPFVSGAAALVRSVRPDSSSAEVRDELCRSALDLGDPGWDPAYGWGRLQVPESLTATVPRDAYESDDSLAEAKPQVAGTVAQHTSAPIGETDAVSFEASAGHRYHVWTEVFGGADTVLTLLAGDRTTVLSGSDDVDVGVDRSSSITWTAPADGVYYLLNVDDFEAGGSYAVHVDDLGLVVSVGTTLTLSVSSAAPSYAAYVTLSGTLHDTSGTALAAMPVRVESSADRVRWSTVTTLQTSSIGGYFSTRVRPSSRTWYRAVFAGSDVFLTGTSVAVAVTPKVSLTTPVAPSTPRHGVLFRAYTDLRPAVPARARSAVRLYWYRYQSGHWVLRKTVWAYGTNSSGVARCAVYVSLPYTGTWRVRAYFTGAAYTSTWSSYRYVSAR